ncbi:MAG: alcohol dehydrogenase catalytic domain-containing protein, partial [Halobacteria archaeon]|nr:alcohol dehydrogenase catalytic domain-containing protein [Halobacteria archaeon]
MESAPKVRGMKAARFYGASEGLKIEDVPLPEIGSNEILVRVEGAGICHSDLHILEGDLPLPNLPTTLGHENAGFVEEIGDELDIQGTGIEQGTPVAVYGPWGCGNCHVCSRGEYQLCNVIEWVGIGHDGGYAEYLRVPNPEYLVRLDSLEPTEAAPLTDAGVTSYRAVRRAEKSLTPSRPIVIIGIGGVGQYAVQFADMLTGSDVIAVDIDDEKLDKAERLGADVTVNGDKNLSSEVRQVSNDGGGTAGTGTGAGAGAGAVLDFVGTDETL